MMDIQRVYAWPRIGGRRSSGGTAGNRIRRADISIVAVILGATDVAKADAKVDEALKTDIVLRALVDELGRGQDGLVLVELPRPYFIEYGLQDANGASFTASLGAITNRHVGKSRRLQTEIRVGSFELDNTNFSDFGGFSFGSMFGMMGGASVPIEDDYEAVRQAIWWSTDREYKSVVETFGKKKAFMQNKIIQDKPNDFSRESAVIYLEDRKDLNLDATKLESLAIGLSNLFREYPDIQSSSVSTSGGRSNHYLVNSEGTCIRRAEAEFSVTIVASAQAADGMRFSDTFSRYARKWEELPSLEEFEKKCLAMSERLLAIRNAPRIDSYSGPVLFDAPAAAAIFDAEFGYRFSGGQRPVGSSNDADDLANKLNKRILPRFLNVVDDSTQEVMDGVPLMGHYLYDDQGVPARRVSLVEQGRLKALLMSRNPSKEFSRSTGHGRGFYGSGASIGCLLVTAENGLSAEALRQEFIEAFQDEDLEFGLRVASLSEESADFSMGFSFEDYYGGGGGGTMPLALFKVYPDGREELARGVQIASVDLRAFKRILAAGDKPFIVNEGGGEGRTVALPALLFEELDLSKIDRDFDKPPVLPTPLARKD